MSRPESQRLKPLMRYKLYRSAEAPRHPKSMPHPKTDLSAPRKVSRFPSLHRLGIGQPIFLVFIFAHADLSLLNDVVHHGFHVEGILINL